MKKKSGITWQVTQSHIKKKKKVKLALLMLLVVLTTVIAGNLLRLVNSLFEPLNSVFDQRTYLWDGDSNLNLVYKNGENISLLVIISGERKVLSLDIPSNTFIKVPGDFGSWELRSIFDLGGGDLKASSKLLKDSLSVFFGLPIDGFLSSSEEIPSSKILRDFKNPFSVVSLLNKLKTDLTPLELISLYTLLQQVRSDKIESFDILGLDVLNSSELADGSHVYLPGSRLDSFISENFSDPKIKNEQKTIAVLNGTLSLGLAQKYSRLISNMGGNVIISDNTEDKVKYSVVFGEDSLTKKRLDQIFTSKYAILDSKFVSRAQITIILGEDLVQ